MLTPDGRILHNYHEWVGDIGFIPKGKSTGADQIDGLKYRLVNVLSGKFVNFGMWVHTDCWKYAKKHLGYQLSYNNFPEHHWNLKWSGDIDGVNYHGIENYQAHDFDFKKILSQIKLTKSEMKKRKSRPSPPISTSLVKNMAYGVGNDGNIWRKKANKWAKTDQFKVMELDMDYKQVSTKIDDTNAGINIYLREQTSYDLNRVFIMDYSTVTKNHHKYKHQVIIIKAKMKICSTMDGIKNFLKYLKKYGVKLTILE
jgi:hypothetical protein